MQSASLNAALTLEPKNADDWNNLGVLQARVGDTASARKDFERALILDPQHAPRAQTWRTLTLCASLLKAGCCRMLRFSLR